MKRSKLAVTYFYMMEQILIYFPGEFSMSNPDAAYYMRKYITLILFIKAMKHTHVGENFKFARK